MLIEALGSYRDLDYRQWNGSSLGIVTEYNIPNTLAVATTDAWGASNQWHVTSQSTIAELRVYAPDEARFRWTIGAFAFNEEQGAFLGQIRDPAGGFNEFNMPSTVGTSYAGYADATFDVTESFRVLGGVRYSRDHKDRLDGLWMLTGTQPSGGLDLGLASDGIGRFGTEGFRYKGFDRPSYVLPEDASPEERVNFFLDGIESFGARDEAAVALCADPPTSMDSNGNPLAVPRLVQIDGSFRCAAGVREGIDVSGFTNPVPQNGERDDDYIDFRVGAEYDLAKDNLLYATLTTGHKAGAFNDTIPLASTEPGGPTVFQTPTYGPETAYSLEIGSKNLLLDRRLKVNASAFAFLYDGMQFQTIIAVGEAPPLDADGNPAIDPDTGMPYIDTRSGSAARQNAQEITPVYGLDIDTAYRLPFGLEAELHALLMRAHFADGTLVNDGRLGLNAAPAEVDLGGNQLPRVSPYTLNYTLSQIIFTTAGRFDWLIQGQTRGEHYMTVFNGDGTRFAPRGPGWGVDPITGEADPIEEDTNEQYAAIARNLERLDDRVPTYTVLNLGAGWQHPDGRLSVRGFVNNVFDTAYANTIISTAGNNIRFYNDPRTAGVRVRMDW